MGGHCAGVETQELWRPVVGWFWYEVSNLGRVRSLDHVATTGRGYRFVRGRILKQVKKGAYLTVNLSDGSKRRTCTVHSLVLRSFAGEPPEGMEACHGPAGKLDNRLVNLRWDTKAANMADKHRDGTAGVVGHKGVDNPRARLAEADVREIRRFYVAGGWSQSALAARFGVGKTTIAAILQRRTWREVDDEGVAA